MNDRSAGLGVWLGLITLAAVGCKTYTAVPYDGGTDLASDVRTTGDAPPDGTVGTNDAPAIDLELPTTEAGADSAPDNSTDAPRDAAADAVGDAVVDSGPDLTKIAAPRLIAPLSTATVTSRRPLLHWILPSGTDGAHVEICHDRACTSPIVAFDTTGAVGAPATDLPPGVVFWHAFGRAAGLTGTTSTPTWQFNVGARSAPVNTSWGTTLDLNGDGYADVVVGGDQVSRAYIYMGSAAGITSAQQPIVLIGPDLGTFGASVASAGDVNGDGYADLLVGDLNAAKAYVYFGGSAGIAPSQQPITLVGPDGTSSNFGLSVAGAGDLNGDGYADVVIGADAVGGTFPLSAGRAYLYIGGASGPSSASAIPINSPDGAGSLFGNSVTEVGDINGDGYSDIAIAASRALNGTGRAYIFTGGPSGISSNQLPVSLTGPDGVNSGFGTHIAGTGDVNGDGYADLIVSTLVGRAYVYSGSSSGVLSAQPTTLVAGIEVSSAGDINGDGYADIISSNTLYQGSAVGVSTARSINLFNPDSSGGTATGVGDVNGDGYADVATGSDGYMDCLGRVYLYTGSAAGFTATQQPVILTGPDIDDEFGVSIAAVVSASGRTGC